MTNERDKKGYKQGQLQKARSGKSYPWHWQKQYLDQVLCDEHHHRLQYLCTRSMMSTATEASIKPKEPHYKQTNKKEDLQ